MKRLSLPVLSVLIITSSGLAAPPATPVVSQVHVISVHVRDHAAFDALFLFLRDVIQLPVVYGEPSNPEDKERRLYAGFSVGNAYLEPCGPYQNDAPFSPAHPMRFHGLTFCPATSLAEDAKELERRNISHSAAVGGGDRPRFVYLTDALLTGKLLAVSIWERQNKNDRASPGFLNLSLQEANGGALGVKRIEEVRIGYPEQATFDQWANFLEPAKPVGDVWSVGNGPALRLVPSKEPQIESIVLQVESLDRAKAILSQKNLVGRASPENIELDVTKIWGLRIVLKETSQKN